MAAQKVESKSTLRLGEECTEDVKVSLRVSLCEQMAMSIVKKCGKQLHLPCNYPAKIHGLCDVYKLEFNYKQQSHNRVFFLIFVFVFLQEAI